MPTGSGVRFTVLVEDKRLERFVRGCLIALGAHGREIRVVTYPVGKGSAKQWIDNQYPTEVKAHRRRDFENIARLVETDADEQTVQQRTRRLADALREAACDARGPGEPIAIRAPKWNIETWLLFSMGADVHEGVNYKDQVGKVSYEAVAREFVERFRRWNGDPGADGNLPSLVLAFEETKRAQHALKRASS